MENTAHKLNNFRLEYETAFLFVLSYEYDIPLAKLISLYLISDKIFWSYLSILSPMSKMGVRKSSQLAKMANRIFKKIRNLSDKKRRKVDVDERDEEGNLVYDEKGNIKKVKRIKIEYFPIILNEVEESLMKVMKYFTTKGYSNGEKFLNDNDVVDERNVTTVSDDVIDINGESYTRSTQIEFVVEKYFPNLSVAEFRDFSVKKISDLINGLEKVEDLEESAT